MGREEAKEELADEEERKIVGVRKRMLWTWGFTVPIIAWMIPEMIMGTTVSYVTGFATLSLPIAMLGLLHPVIAEAAMAFSSVSVVTNANRLRKVDIRPS